EGGTQRANLPRRARVAARMTTRDGVMRRPPRWLARAMFCKGMPRTLANWTLNGLVSEASAVFDEPVSRRSQMAPPATYICLARDRAMRPTIATRQIANYSRPMDVVVVDGAHDVMISQPEALAEILNDCIAGI